jgi:hypothetical protein
MRGYGDSRRLGRLRGRKTGVMLVLVVATFESDELSIGRVGFARPQRR